MSSNTTPPQSQEERFPLSQCTPSDIPQLFQVWQSAFAHYPAQQLMLPETMDPAEIYAWYAKRVNGQMTKPEIQFFKITDAQAGKIVAFARWHLPHAKTAEELEGEEKRKRGEKQTIEWPKGTNIALCEDKFGMLDDWRDKYVDATNTYVAMLLATSPDYQRKGFGSRLLKCVLDIADTEGRLAYIEASPEGHPVYQRLGFEDLNVIDLDLEQYEGGEGMGKMRTVAMLRQPKGVAVVAVPAPVADVADVADVAVAGVAVTA